MPEIEINGVILSYREFGDANKRTIIFTHSLLWDSTMFDRLIEQLTDDFHIINIDQHGHGHSGYRSPLVLEEMAADYHALLDALKLDQVDWAGLSMGGMVGMRLALGYPARIRSLILMDTSARSVPEEQREMTLQMNEILRTNGAADVADAILQLFFAPATFRSQPELIEQYRTKLINYQPEQLAAISTAAMAVISRTDISDLLHKISVPTLVIVGQDDAATLPEESELIAERIAGAKLMILNEIGHMSATEQPDVVAGLIKQFLQTN